MKGFDLPEQISVQLVGSPHQHIVKEIRHISTGRIPGHLGSGMPFSLGIAILDDPVSSSFCMIDRIRLRIKSPVRDVDPL